MTPREEAHLQVLRILAQRPEVSQRELAEELSISLGKINYLMKALVEKGLIKAKNFRRSDNKLGYLYELTPGGIEAHVRLARAYLARKEAEYEALRQELFELREQLSRSKASAAERCEP